MNVCVKYIWIDGPVAANGAVAIHTCIMFVMCTQTNGIFAVIVGVVVVTAAATYRLAVRAATHQNKRFSIRIECDTFSFS